MTRSRPATPAVAGAVGRHLPGRRRALADRQRPDAGGHRSRGGRRRRTPATPRRYRQPRVNPMRVVLIIEVDRMLGPAGSGRSVRVDPSGLTRISLVTTTALSEMLVEPIDARPVGVAVSQPEPRLRRSITDIQADYERGNKTGLETLMRAWRGIKALPPETRDRSSCSAGSTVSRSAVRARTTRQLGGVATASTAPCCSRPGTGPTCIGWRRPCRASRAAHR